jgi:hypothetical protein
MQNDPEDNIMTPTDPNGQSAVASERVQQCAHAYAIDCDWNGVPGKFCPMCHNVWVTHTPKPVAPDSAEVEAVIARLEADGNVAHKPYPIKGNRDDDAAALIAAYRAKVQECEQLKEQFQAEHSLVLTCYDQLRGERGKVEALLRADKEHAHGVRGAIEKLDTLKVRCDALEQENTAAWAKVDRLLEDKERLNNTYHKKALTFVNQRDAAEARAAASLSKVAALEMLVSTREKELAEWIQAVGLISTLKSDMEIDASQPLRMAHEVHAHVTDKLQQLTAEWETSAQLRDLLSEAQNGLQWYQSEYPEDDSPEDDEMHERIDAALAAATELRDKTAQPVTLQGGSAGTEQSTKLIYCTPAQPPKDTPQANAQPEQVTVAAVMDKLLSMGSEGEYAVQLILKAEQSLSTAKPTDQAEEGTK